MSINIPTTSNLPNYVSWKGTGSYSYPVAITSGNRRPLTNNDPRNNAPQKFGLPRPLKWQYRQGISLQPKIININPENPNEYIDTSTVSHSSIVNLVGLTIDQPGRYSVKRNQLDETTESTQYNKDCQKCYGVSLVDNFSPEPYLTNNPEQISTNPKFCCNQEKNAKKMVVYASTNLKSNYYNSNYQYLQNRCQTFQQKSFNFTSPLEEISDKLAKPGSPLILSNTYIANCFPNIDERPEVNVVYQIFNLIKSQGLLTENDIQQYNEEDINTLFKMNQFLSNIEGNKDKCYKIYFNYINNPYVGYSIQGPSNKKGCKAVVYKPSNPQFAVEGGVSSGTRLLKLTTDTINTNIASIKQLSGSSYLSEAGYNPFIYKNKYTTCDNSKSTYMRLNRNNKCSSISDSEYYKTKSFSKLGNF
jgi:hypothetical protein